MIIISVYFIASTLTFIIYALDKSAARNHRWRINENTLHFFALIGGWPGAWAAQQLLRHKSKKASFRAIFWITVVLNCTAVWWLIHASFRRDYAL